MPPEPIPANVTEFLAAEVRSLIALELLLLLFRDAARAWSIAELARELRADQAWTAQEVGLLCGRALAVLDSENPPIVRCAVLAEPAAASLAWLSAMYPERRHTIIQMLYREPPAPAAIQKFAEAFNLRKEPPGG